MRKAYAKPLLYAEGFELVEHMAAGCAYMANFSNDCQITVDGITFFTPQAGCNDETGNGILGGVVEDLSKATLDDFYRTKMTCYNSFVDFTTGQFFVS